MIEIYPWFSALLSGEIDACGGKGVTAERQEYFDFTDVYYQTFDHFFVKEGNPLDFDEENIEGKNISECMVFLNNYMGALCYHLYCV